MSSAQYKTILPPSDRVEQLTVAYTVKYVKPALGSLNKNEELAPIVSL